MALKIERRDDRVGAWTGTRSIVWTADTIDALERLCTGSLPQGTVLVPPDEAPTQPALPVFADLED